MRRRDAGEPAPSPLQVDVAANRIVVDFAAARRGRNAARPGTREAGRPTPRKPADNADGTAPATMGEQASGPVPDHLPDRSVPVGSPLVSGTAQIAADSAASGEATEKPHTREDNATWQTPPEAALSDIPVIPLEPDPQEFGRDLDAEVYIPAEHGDRKRKARRGRGTKPRSFVNPFGMIERRERPKGHAPVPKWQKVLMTVCGIAIAVILVILTMSGWITLPGLHQGVLVRTSIVYLGNVITLPYEPQTVTWQVLTDEDQTGFGATRERLIAVIQFTPEQAAELVARATPMEQPEGSQAIEDERWFPDDIDDLTDEIDSDMTVYDASVFTTNYFKRGIMAPLGESGYMVVKLFNY